jgi:hypothetical protein
MEIEMTNLECATCFVPFAISNRMYKALTKCHNAFYCPCGHANYFYAETAEEKLKRQLKEKQEYVDRLVQEKHDLQKQIKPKIKRKSTPKTK